MARILEVPDEILEPILALVTEPVRSEYTPEPDGSENPNGETQYQVGLLQLVCKRFNRIAVAGHFKHHAHWVALEKKVALVDTPTGEAFVRRVDFRGSACTFVENDRFFCANTQHIKFFANIVNILDAQLVLQKVRHVLLTCEAVTSVSVDRSLVSAEARPAVFGAMYTIVEEAEQRLKRAIGLQFDEIW